MELFKRLLLIAVVAMYANNSVAAVKKVSDNTHEQRNDEQKAESNQTTPKQVHEEKIDPNNVHEVETHLRGGRIVTIRIIKKQATSGNGTITISSDKAFNNKALFLKKYAPPHDLRCLIETHKDLIIKTFHGQIDQLPEYFIKGDDISRIINAERLRRFIQKKGLNCLDVPRKYVYKVDDKNNKSLVFAENIKPANGSPSLKLSLKEVQQLATLVDGTCYGDFGLGDSNIIRDYRNKLVIIDTEDNSFSPQSIFDVCSENMTPEAAKWLEEHKHCKKQLYKKNDNSHLPENIEFDDSEIDFELIKLSWFRL